MKICNKQSGGKSPDVVRYNTVVNGFYRFKKMNVAREKLFVNMKWKNI